MPAYVVVSDYAMAALLIGLLPGERRAKQGDIAVRTRGLGELGGRHQRCGRPSPATAS
jgi:hypothetical protein